VEIARPELVVPFFAEESVHNLLSPQVPKEMESDFGEVRNFIQPGRPSLKPLALADGFFWLSTKAKLSDDRVRNWALHQIRGRGRMALT
jgi:hypothetical protein